MIFSIGLFGKRIFAAELLEKIEGKAEEKAPDSPGASGERELFYFGEINHAPLGGTRKGMKSPSTLL